ncbi:CAP domain-containing protein [Radiobacillus deserti]|uniref:SCP-like extracellular protein n=1 Tax=Radiobacillus deserti TaxID=2594883 RepID=A0A516KKJ7_9BACI|nr:CAP domain-containing protein [Radiobacillus deserti]QDP41920.1 SCP-like extracellular protein [Radiobacillus deserti]
MKMNKLIFTVVALFFGLLVACNNNDQAMDNRGDRNLNISSLRTDSNSQNYPETEPIKIQDKKYEFRTKQGTDRNQQQGTNQQNQNNQGEQPQAQQQPSKQVPKNTTQGTHEFVTAVIELTNAERQKEGLPPLKAYPDLNNVAGTKAKDMHDKGYFSHTSPTYGSPFDMMRDFGITYQAAGENIAQGQQSPEDVVNAWMNSEGHRANILDENFTHIGVGFEKSGYQWVQMFVKK